MATPRDRPAKKHQKRTKLTLYDAVAGRCGYEGFLTSLPPSKHRDTLSSSTKPVPPEEVLFRRKGAPVRYEEDDVYFADRHLQPGQRLPDSDLLKVLHAYAADYYGAMSAVSGDAGGEGKDFGSLDESALLAVGILVEEAARDALGETGHLALVEAADGEDGLSGDESSSSGGSG